MQKYLTWFLFFVVTSTVSGTYVLQEQFNWNALDFTFPSQRIRDHFVSTKRFIPRNNLPVGIEIWNEKLFITVPRWKQGVPSTLNYIQLEDSGSRSPSLIPYPDWAANEMGDCENGLTTVYRIKVDECDRLWVLDTGTFGIENTTRNLCPYALNIFDLKTDKRLRRYELRSEDINVDTFIANIAVDIGEDCTDAHAYMSDELGYGLIVYSWRDNISWRFVHSFFRPDPLAGNFNIGGLNFQWDSEGIFGMTLSPKLSDGSRTLFFSPLASNAEFAVSTAVLRNSSKVSDPKTYYDFVVVGDRGPNSHITTRVMDEYGMEFFNLIDRNAIGCWNSQHVYDPAYLGIVDQDNEALIFPSDIKVDRNRNIWVISDRMPNFLLSTLNYEDVNFRIFFASIDVLVQSTICKFF